MSGTRHLPIHVALFRPSLWPALMALFLPAAAVGGEISGRVLDSEGKPLADAVVFVTEADSPVRPPGAGAPAVMDQVGEQFVPHVLPIVVGTEVQFPNNDQIHHHVYSFSRAKTFEIPLYKGELAPPIRFETPGVVKLGCNIHDWMSAVILVLPNPHFAKTDEDGEFLIRGVPEGTAELAAWHELADTSVGNRRRMQVGAGTESISFTLPIETRPRRRPVLGVRGYR